MYLLELNENNFLLKIEGVYREPGEIFKNR